MSTVQATTFQDRATLKSLGVERVIEGTAKAWVNFNGATMNIRDGFNVSSLTDHGVGLYTANLTAAMSSASYMSQRSSSVNGTTYGWSPAASTCSVSTMNASGAVADASFVDTGVWGDLA